MVCRTELTPNFDKTKQKTTKKVSTFFYRIFYQLPFSVFLRTKWRSEITKNRKLKISVFKKNRNYLLFFICFYHIRKEEYKKTKKNKSKIEIQMAKSGEFWRKVNFFYFCSFSKLMEWVFDEKKKIFFLKKNKQKIKLSNKKIWNQRKKKYTIHVVMQKIFIFSCLLFVSSWFVIMNIQRSDYKKKNCLIQVKKS